ncbi:unnamed protein product [Echinostoma caproni]|uniref:EF-hand domain-containing protein n=1 Tax=Echinostoma caproni TaxID=27848 RepID=A0A183A9H4_9TREM|nr:unnamed protein product [Echinostoma caproni]
MDEIEYLLQEKARHNFRELRHNFILNDPEGVGNVSRANALSTFCVWLNPDIFFFCMPMVHYGMYTRRSLSSANTNVILAYSAKAREQIAPTLGILQQEEDVVNASCRYLNIVYFILHLALINFTEFYTAILNDRPALSSSRVESSSSMTKCSVLHERPRGFRVRQHRSAPRDPCKRVPKSILAECGDEEQKATALVHQPQSTWTFLTQLGEEPEQKPILLAHQAIANKSTRIVKLYIQTVMLGMAETVFVLLNLQARWVLDAEDLVGCAEFHRVPMIEVNAFADRMNQLGFNLSQAEFLKVWKRFEPDSHGRVARESILRHLFLEPRLEDVRCPETVNDCQAQHMTCHSVLNMRIKHGRRLEEIGGRIPEVNERSHHHEVTGFTDQKSKQSDITYINRHS